MKKKTELELAVEALPPCPKKARRWTLEEDAVVLKYTEDKGSAAIGRLIGVTGTAVRRRWEFLKQQLRK